MKGKKKFNSPESLVYFYIMTKKNIFREKFPVAKIQLKIESFSLGKSSLITPKLELILYNTGWDYNVIRRRGKIVYKTCVVLEDKKIMFLRPN